MRRSRSKTGLEMERDNSEKMAGKRRTVVGEKMGLVAYSGPQPEHEVHR